jgi:phage gp46-like protein
MQTGIDLKLSRQASLGGMYDLSITNGELDLIDNFDTSLQMSVYSEKRADGSEVLPPEQRRGWWGNETASILGFEIGSKIWILYQSRLDQNVLNKMINYTQQALQWLVDGNYLTKYEVDGEIIEASKVRLIIKLYRSPDQIDTKFFDLWNNTTSVDERSL